MCALCRQDQTSSASPATKIGIRKLPHLHIAQFLLFGKNIPIDRQFYTLIETNHAECTYLSWKIARKRINLQNIHVGRLLEFYKFCLEDSSTHQSRRDFFLKLYIENQLSFQLHFPMKFNSC